MFAVHDEKDYTRRAYLRAFGLLMLLGLAACGSAEQPSGAEPAGTSPAADRVPSQAVPESDQATTTQVPASVPAPPSAQLPTPPLRRRPTAPPIPPQPIKPTSAAAPTAASSSADGWQRFRSTAAGWRITYPPDWTAREQNNEDAVSITTFVPADGAGISVVVQAGVPPAIQPSEKVNIICARVVVGRLSGNRCVDTAKGTIATTLAGRGRTYIIATTGKGIDEQVYQRVLDSFVAGDAS